MSDDPVVRRRQQIDRFVRATKALGYLLLLVSIVAFGIGALLDFPDWAVRASVVGLVGSCIVLPIPIVLGYAVRKAEREDPLTGTGPRR
jgi:ABC-type Fe3+ transport system permease subunit